MAAAAFIMLVSPAGALAHADPPSHYLETDLLYPAFGSRPAPALELGLLGLLQASQANGYPIRVALVANETDLTEDPSFLTDPQGYAELVVEEVEAETGITFTAPVLVVTPAGFGVAGRDLRNSSLQTVDRARASALTAAVPRPSGADGDALATAAIVAVRRVAELGGHPLPASVPPASAAFNAPDKGIDWLPLIVFAAVFVPAWIVYELVTRRGRSRAVEPAELSRPRPPGP